MPLAPGARLGPYEIRALIGTGGMGLVYRARDPRLDRTVAIKVYFILVHRSCFYDSTLLGDPALDEKYRDQLYPWPADKLDAFMGYIGQTNPRTHFVVYSRRGWPSDAERLAWMTGVERRFPTIKGRLHSYKVPLDRATFRHTQTGEEVRKIVVGLLTSTD